MLDLNFQITLVRAVGEPTLADTPGSNTVPILLGALRTCYWRSSQHELDLNSHTALLRAVGEPTLAETTFVRGSRFKHCHSVAECPWHM